MTKCHSPLRGAALGLLVCAVALAAQPALAVDISYRSFSMSATMGPQAEAYAAKLRDVTATALGDANQVRFVKLPGIPAVPSQFGGNLVAATAAGSAGGGFDAVYISGSDLNKTWGFLYNSCFPFGPSFDEYLGFLYGKSVNGGQMTGLQLLQSIYDSRGANVVALPIVGSSEQLSGYFPLPIGEAPGMKGIGLAGFCQQPWTLRYLPPGENVLGRACDILVQSGAIPAKNIKFIAAIPGGGSLTSAVKYNGLSGFEFATPLDDVSQLWVNDPVTGQPINPGTVGVRYVHLPGWQQQFLITWMLVNRQVWDALTPAQQTLAYTVARDHVLSSYGENMRQQGEALRFILNSNKNDGDPTNDLVLVKWPERDQQLLSAATNRFLNDRVNDGTLSSVDRQDYATILEALRQYISSNNVYWVPRPVAPKMKYDDWFSSSGEEWNPSLRWTR